MANMIDDFYLVRGGYKTIAAHSERYFGGKRELFIHWNDELIKFGEFQLNQRKSGLCEIIFRHMTGEHDSELDDCLENAIISYFQVLKNKGVDFAFIDQEMIQSTERTLLNANAAEVIRLFYDKVKHFERKVFYASQITNGKKVTFTHLYKEILLSNENHKLAITDVVYAPRVNPRFGGSPKFGNALMISAWQIQSDRAFIHISYSTFFEDIVTDVLSKVQQLEPIPIEVFKATPVEEWQPWEHMPGSTELERGLVKLAYEKTSSKVIGELLFIEPDQVDQRLSRLRRTYPAARIPFRQRKRAKKKKKL